MKNTRYLSSLILLMTFVFSAIPLQNALAASDALALAPLSYTTQSGKASGAVGALAVRDQDGWDDDNPSKYVLFTTPGVKYSGIRAYQLPAGIQASAVQALRVEASYRGPVKASQAWAWAIYNWQQKTWVTIGDNAAARDGEWTVLIFNIPNPQRFVNANRNLWLRLTSGDSSGNARLDYEAIHALYAPAAPPTPVYGKIASPPAGNLYHGVYPGGVTGEEDDLTLNDLQAYETAAGKSAAWVYFSHNWYHGRAFPLAAATWIRNAGSVPYVRLMLRNDSNGNHADPVYPLQRIINGVFDSDLRGWCAGARDFGAPILAEYGTEVNGAWFPWNGKWAGGGATTGFGDPTLPDGPERFRVAYRRIIRLCNEEGAKNITWVFHANDGDWPNANWNRMENYYPGDAWIDWLAVSVYGAQTPLDTEWPIFRQDMDAFYPRLAALSASKPIIVAEFGVTSKNPLGSQALWAQNALTDITSFRYPRVIAFSWWNEWWQNDENPAHDTDMRVQDNPNLTQVFQTLVGSNALVLGQIP